MLPAVYRTRSCARETLDDPHEFLLHLFFRVPIRVQQ
jgi:hypothetical protein